MTQSCLQFPCGAAELSNVLGEKQTPFSWYSIIISIALLKEQIKKDQLLYMVVCFFIRYSMGRGFVCVFVRERDREGGAVLRYILLYLVFSSFQINILLLSSPSRLLSVSLSVLHKLQGS